MVLKVGSVGVCQKDLTIKLPRAKDAMIDYASIS